MRAHLQGVRHVLQEIGRQGAEEVQSGVHEDTGHAAQGVGDEPHLLGGGGQRVVCELEVHGEGQGLLQDGQPAREEGLRSAHGNLGAELGQLQGGDG